jgi:mono/diheme cytochrome c family protein
VNNRLILLAVAAVAIGAIVWRCYPHPAEPGTGTPIVEVKVPELDAVALAGKQEFDKNCANCHGANAAGQEGVAPPLVHNIYEPGHHVDQSFYLAAKQGVRAHHWPFGNMPPVEGITDTEINQIVSYVRALQRANGIN